jgi:cytochrome P450
MAPAFSSRHINRMNRVACEKVNEWIETRLSAFVERDESFDVGLEMVDITLSAISETAFEYLMSRDERQQFSQDLRTCFDEFCFKSSLNPLRKMCGVFLYERRLAHAAANRIHVLSMKIIKSFRQLTHPIKDTIIDSIVNNNISYKNDNERAADVTVLLVAGHDTTAYTIAWTLRELAKHPKEQRMLRDSLRSSDARDIQKSDHLRKVVKESMRLHPVAAGASIRTLGRDLVSENYFLPKGTLAFIPLILMHRNANVYERPDSFVPSRWDEPTAKMKDSFNPYSAGKQNCIGQSLANAEIMNIVSRVCYEYELKLIDEGQTEFCLFLKPVKAMVKAKKIVS